MLSSNVNNLADNVRNYLYNIFKFIDKSEIKNKHFYSNLVRAQLSNHELSILFYNSLSQYGSEKFSPLIVKYSVLKNMPQSVLLYASHTELIQINSSKLRDGN